MGQQEVLNVLKKYDFLQVADIKKKVKRTTITTSLRKLRQSKFIYKLEHKTGVYYYTLIERHKSQEDAYNKLKIKLNLKSLAAKIIPFISMKFSYLIKAQNNFCSLK